MDDLTPFKIQATELCSNFDIYPIKWAHKEKILYWNNDSLESFLAFARKLSKKMLYFSELKFTLDTMPPKEVLGQIEIAFLHEGFFHTFRKEIDLPESSDAAVEEDEVTEADPLEINNQEYDDILKREVEDKSIEVLTNDLVAYVKSAVSDDELTEDSIRTFDGQFWEDRNVDRWGAEPKHRSKMEQVEKKAHKIILQELLEKEAKILPDLEKKCYEWCVKQEMKKMLKGQLKYFLNEESIQLTKMGQEKLFLKVNIELTKR